ncbi:TPA: hypothetical protein SL386_001688 [Pseudomonas aeruginosa]|nr:hypothetical protein [Pseudomonas aeruginosa]HEJ6312657.1 hypothetical protein [Pseudomonas aeruginosa]
MPMTKQKRAYVEGRLAGMGQKEAALAAGCSEKYAKQRGYQLEKDPDVLAAMGRASAAQSSLDTQEPLGDPDTYIPAPVEDPVQFFKNVTNDLNADPKLRLDAAKAWAQFTVAKPGEKGKKEERQEKAEEAGKSSRFGLRKGHLKAVN